MGTHTLTAVAVDNQFARGTSGPVTITVFGAPQPPPSISLIPTGSVWKYLDDGSDQGIAWRNLGYDDSTWASGPGQLGFGDGDEVTVIRRENTNTGLSHVTFYFRRIFAVTNSGSISNLAVRLLRDDGGVVYLNGTEVFRSNMPTGEVNHLTLAPTAACCEDETSRYYEASINPGLLVPGPNVVAVEIHQNTITSADLSFDLELAAGDNTVPPPEPAVVSVVAADPDASEPGATTAIYPGQFRFTRTGNLNTSLLVRFSLVGTASNIVDYNFVSNHVTIPAGATQAVVNIVPVEDGIPEGTETVVLTLLSPVCSLPDCYVVGAPNQATVFISDSQPGTNNPPPVVRVFASDSSASENNPMFSTGRYTFTRTGPISNSLPVFFAMSGTASRGFDYFIGSNSMVVIPAGSSNAHLILTPIDDAEVEPTENAVLTVMPPPPGSTPFYLVGSPSNATVFIQDNDGDTNNPPEQTVVHVVSTDPQAAEGGTNANPGQFAIRRSGNLSSAIPVLFTLSGTASNSVDYNFVSNSVVIPAGATQAVVNIIPRNDLQVEGTETVVLTLRTPACAAILPPPPECYALGSPTEAVVTIADAQGGGTNNSPPLAFWLSPPNGASFTQAMSILLQASAHDSDGSILRVEFRNNGALIGLNTSSAGTNYSFFWSNAPVGTHTLTAVAVDNQFARGTSAPVTITVFGAPQPPPSISLIPTGSVWKYLDDGSDQGIAWRNLGFDDSTWASGPGQLGFGDGDEATFIRRGDSNTALSHITYYFRRSFVVTNGGSISNLIVRLLRDDGGVVYLNGTEVFRSNMPTGEVNYLTLAPVAACCEDETSHYYEAPVDSGLLVPGVNVVAVEIHQNNAASSDLSFDLELTSGGTVPPPTERTIIHVVATDPQASEGGTNSNIGQFAIRRTGNIGSDVPVHYRMGGTASNGVDYSFVSNSLVILAGSTQALVNINPLTDNFIEGTETVTLTLLPSGCPNLDPPPPGCYLIGSPTQAVVNIADAQGGGTNSAPLAFWLSPPNGSVFTQGMGILLQASAHDFDGTIARVEFRRSGILIGISTSPGGTNGDYSFFWSNAPAGTHTLTAVAVDNLLARGTSAPVTITILGAPQPPPSISLIPTGSVWRYLDDGSDQGVAWRNLGFDDSTWTSGPGQLGFGDGDEATFIRRGDSNTGLSHVTFYFRRTFGVTNLSSISNLVVRLLRDDGGVVYLNGTEVFRSNMPTGEVNHLTMAPVAACCEDETSRYYEASVDPGLLVPGPNVVAVEIHQNSINSSDVSFDLELLAQRGGTNRLPIAQWLAPPNGSVITQGMGILLRASAHDFDGTITRVEFRRSGALIGFSTAPLGSNYSFFWSNAPAGSHVLTAVAVDNLNGRGTSSPVTITVLGQPTNLPPMVTITRPTNGMSFNAPTIFIEAVTRDLDGYADTVEFFDGDQKIGQSQVVFIHPPNPGESIHFEFIWTNPPPGSHVLRARTVDNRGAPGVSAPVEITVIGDGDTDDDGVPDDRDQCPGTVAGAIVNEHGCSIAQLCPCEGPWRNHSEYVQCVRSTSLSFVEAGLITPAQREAILIAAIASDCGRRGPRLIVPQQSSGDIKTSGCRLLLEGDGPATCIVECSTDLGQWTPISTNTLSGATIEIVDPGACNSPRRFYRMRVQ